MNTDTDTAPDTWELPPTPLRTVWQALAQLCGQGWLAGPPPWLTHGELLADVELAQGLPCDHCGDAGPGGLTAAHHPGLRAYKAWRTCTACRHAQEV